MQNDNMADKPSLTSARVFGGTTDSNKLFSQFVQNIMMFLDLMSVVEKPEIVQAKEQKLKSLGQKYVVKLLIFCTN